MEKVYVYAIYDTYSREIYVGISKHVEKRVREHRSGKSRSTKKYKDVKLFYTEEFESYLEARKREKYLKSNFGKVYLRGVLRDSGILNQDN